MSKQYIQTYLNWAKEILSADILYGNPMSSRESAKKHQNPHQTLIQLTRVRYRCKKQQKDKHLHGVSPQNPYKALIQAGEERGSEYAPPHYFWNNTRAQVLNIEMVHCQGHA